ncbi:rCG32762 [Rattus norvegicus]|uniref:RCG32762 n=1 Tax=Rattus norvegicus TaxID=10116 RepID=A6HL18_RAT|nr:rCG32762 [Rattus norvegicus]
MFSILCTKAWLPPASPEF